MNVANPEFHIALEAFLQRLNDDTQNGPGVYGRDRFFASIDGRQYHRIYSQRDGAAHRSARYFVRIEDGTIFASASWRAPNFKRSYGTLDTAEQFDWSGFNGVAKPDSIYEMVPTRGGYFTAVLKNVP